MPIYEYECPKCGSFEQTQSIHDAPLSRCPTCRRKVQRLISRAAFHLKGGGWYADGYASGSGKAAAAAATESSSTSPDTAAKSDASAPATEKPALKQKKAGTTVA